MPHIQPFLNGSAAVGSQPNRQRGRTAVSGEPVSRTTDLMPAFKIGSMDAPSEVCLTPNGTRRGLQDPHRGVSNGHERKPKHDARPDDHTGWNPDERMKLDGDVPERITAHPSVVTQHRSRSRTAANMAKKRLATNRRNQHEARKISIVVRAKGAPRCYGRLQSVHSRFRGQRAR